METLEWNADYATGIAEIDRQHRYLFALGARLARSAESVDDVQEIAYTICELSQYANEHFVFEEQVMEKAGYEHLAYHKAMHEFMRTRLALHARLRLIPGLNEKNFPNLALHIALVTVTGILFVLTGVLHRFGGIW
jgi:hemerythrin-like metal-binding protein